MDQKLNLKTSAYGANGLLCAFSNGLTGQTDPFKRNKILLEAAIETDFKDFSVGADYFAPVRVLQKYVYQVPMHLLVQSYRADHILLFRNFKELP